MWRTMQDQKKQQLCTQSTKKMNCGFHLQAQSHSMTVKARMASRLHSGIPKALLLSHHHGKYSSRCPRKTRQNSIKSLMNEGNAKVHIPTFFFLLLVNVCESMAVPLHL